MIYASHGDVMIRPYEPGDRDAVRRIACDTANAGRPVESLFADRELAADLLTSYYTDYEPESAWVAEQAGRVAGYVTGCRDTRWLTRMTAWRILPGAIRRAAMRGTLWNSGFRRLIGRNAGVWARALFQRRASLAEYPAHLHVNLDPALRGKQVGRRLAERFLAQLATWRVPGVHAGVREDNAGALRFFERLGFVPIRRHPFLRQEDRVLYSIILGKKLT